MDIPNEKELSSHELISDGLSPDLTAINSKYFERCISNALFQLLFHVKLTLQHESNHFRVNSYSFSLFTFSI